MLTNVNNQAIDKCFFLLYYKYNRKGNEMEKTLYVVKTLKSDLTEEKSEFFSELQKAIDLKNQITFQSFFEVFPSVVRVWVEEA